MGSVRRATRIGVGVALAALVLTTAACSKTSTPTAATTAPASTASTSSSSTTQPASASAPAPTQWDAVDSHIGTDGQLDLAGTRLAFSLLFHRLPGVALPKGAATSDLRSSGSMVARAVLDHWSELSLADRRIMAPYFDPTGSGSTGLAGAGSGSSTGIGASTGTSTTSEPSTSTTGPTSPATRSLVRGVGPRQSVRLDAAIRTAARSTRTAALQQASDDVWTIAQDEATRLGISAPARSFFQVRFASSELLDAKGSLDGADMWTEVLAANATLDPTQTKVANDQSGPAQRCIVFVSPHVAATIPSSGPVTGSPVEQLAHEVFHCYQGGLIGRADVQIFDREPAFLIEGGAAWAGADFAGTNAGYQAWWNSWLQKTSKSLLERSYSAIGFYSTLQSVGGLSWSTWADVFNQLQTYEMIEPADIFHLLTKDVDGLAAAWAPAYARDQSWGQDWDQTGIDIGSAKPDVRTAALADGSNETVVAQPYTVGELDITASDPVIVTITAVDADAKGVVRIHDAGSLDEIVKPSATLCLGGTCGCEKDRAGQPIGDDATGPVRVAVTAMDSTQSVAITAKANDKTCEPSKPGGDDGGTATDPNSPGGTTCIGNCGASNGDPHLTTINGFHYDMQGIGEFVMLQSGPTAKGAPFELQTRDVAHEPKPPIHYTCNLVVAMSWGGPRITVTTDLAGTDAPTVRVDGKVVHLPTTVSGGVQLDEDPSHVVTATGADGIVVIVRPLPEYGEHLLVELPTRLVTSMHGLLAPAVDESIPARDGHLVSLDSGGTTKGMHSRDEREYHDLVDSWRVTQAESLFDYGKGQSTKTFTDRSAPDLTVLEAFPTAAELAAADELCAAVSPEWLRGECAYDVASTGNHGLVASYKALKPATGRSTTVTKVLHPGDTVPLHGYSGSVTYHLSITRTGFLDITFAVGCFGGFPGQVSDGHTAVVETSTKNPLGTVTTEPETCDDQIGVPVLKTGIYTITFVSKGVKDAKTGFTISKIRQVQFTH